MAKGFDIAEFTKAIAKVPKAIRDHVDAANEASAKEWVSTAKSAAPADPEDGTPLRDSIRHERTETGGQIVRAGGATTTKDGPGGTYDYARAQEFGRVDMPASPYFWTSYRLLKKRFISRRRRALTQSFKVFNGR